MCGLPPCDAEDEETTAAEELTLEELGEALDADELALDEDGDALEAEEDSTFEEDGEALEAEEDSTLEEDGEALEAEDDSTLEEDGAADEEEGAAEEELDSTLEDEGRADEEDGAADEELEITAELELGAAEDVLEMTDELELLILLEVELTMLELLEEIGQTPFGTIGLLSPFRACLIAFLTQYEYGLPQIGFFASKVASQREMPPNLKKALVLLSLLTSWRTSSGWRKNWAPEVASPLDAFREAGRPA